MWAGFDVPVPQKDGRVKVDVVQAPLNSNDSRDLERQEHELIQLREGHANRVRQEAYGWCLVCKRFSVPKDIRRLVTRRYILREFDVNEYYEPVEDVYTVVHQAGFIWNCLIDFLIHCLKATKFPSLDAVTAPNELKCRRKR